MNQETKQSMTFHDFKKKANYALTLAKGEFVNYRQGNLLYPNAYNSLVRDEYSNREFLLAIHVYYLMMLSYAVVLHEFSHFLMAKLLGIFIKDAEFNLFFFTLNEEAAIEDGEKYIKASASLGLGVVDNTKPGNKIVISIPSSNKFRLGHALICLSPLIMSLIIVLTLVLLLSILPGILKIIPIIGIILSLILHKGSLMSTFDWKGLYSELKKISN